MGDKSAIEWTDATWNPIVGCSIVSPGCRECYAMGQAARIQRMAVGAGCSTHYNGTTKIVNGKTVWTGKVAIAPEHILHAPIGWKKPRRIFVNSMGDLFHEDMPDAWIDIVFAVMALCPQHTFQVLTKRSKRMREYVTRMHRNNSGANPKIADQSDALVDDVWAKLFLPNVWLGVSAENQHWLMQRATDLVETPAAIRFLSCEPLLNPLDLTPFIFPVKQWGNGWQNDYPFQYPKHRIDWIIVGGESGPGARPMHPAWARSIRDQCAAARVPFFFKQWGEWFPVDNEGEDGWQPLDGREPGTFEGVRVAIHQIPEGTWARVGKKRGGRLLDGIEHNGYPADA